MKSISLPIDHLVLASCSVKKNLILSEIFCSHPLKTLICPLDGWENFFMFMKNYFSIL